MNEIPKQDDTKDLRVETEKEMLSAIELFILMLSGSGYICLLVVAMLEIHGNFLWLFQSLSGACLAVVAMTLCMNSIPNYESAKVIRKIKMYGFLTVVYFWTCYTIASIVTDDIVWLVSVVPAGVIVLHKVSTL